QLLRVLVGIRADDVELVLEFLRHRHLGHRDLVAEARLVDVEGRREVEDRLAVLDGRDAARGERAAVERTVDKVHDRRARIAPAQEAAARRVRVAALLGGRPRRGQRLRERLAAEHAAGAYVAALAAVDVALEGSELEDADQVSGGGHGGAAGFTQMYP